jgi:hypothetical protein
MGNIRNRFPFRPSPPQLIFISPLSTIHIRSTSHYGAVFCFGFLDYLASKCQSHLSWGLLCIELFLHMLAIPLLIHSVTFFMLTVGADKNQLSSFPFNPRGYIHNLGNNLLTLTASVCPRNYAAGHCFFLEFLGWWRSFSQRRVGT